MSAKEKVKKEHAPEDRVTGSLSMLYRQWQELKIQADKQGLSMSAYVATKLKL